MAEAKRSVVRPYPPDYVDAATLAYRLCVSESTIDNLVRRGKLPRAIDFHGIARWKWAEVERLIDQPRQEGEDEILAAIKRQ